MMANITDFDLTGSRAANFLGEYGEFQRDIFERLEAQAQRLKAVEDKIHVYEEVIRILHGVKT